MRVWQGVVVAAVAVPLLVRAADTSLLEALRKNDVAAVRTLLTAGADPNTRDETGASALMYAAVYSSPDEMRLLIGKGADVNSANANGSTALMWSAGETAKVDLLLQHGANVSAKTKNGTTALIAAGNHGNQDAVRRLVARGADPRATNETGIGLQSVALFRTDNAVERTLSAAGLRLMLPTRSADSPLSNAVTNPTLLKEFLELGANPKEALPLVTREVPAVSYAAYSNQRETLRQLVARGADLNVKDNYGDTPLMMAAGAAHPEPATVRFLLERGADVHVKNKAGRTALDWALLQGDTPVVQLLRSAGAPAGTLPAAPPPVATPRSPRDAIALAAARLQPVGPTFNQRFRCISCHNQSLPAVAVRLASEHGIPVDRGLAAHPASATLTMWAQGREQLLLGDISAVPGFVANVPYGLFGLAEEGVDANPVIDAVVVGLAASQNRDGSWFIGDIRPPIGDLSALSFTALAVRALDRYSPPGRRTEMQKRIARARGFIGKTEPASTQDEAFKLLGLLWSKAPAGEVARASQRLAKLQRPEGGWAQRPTMAPDAYATGQSLYALHTAGMAPSSTVYQKGARYLLQTQLDDGTWFVRSRAFGFQPSFDAGFPHGRDQFISAAATAWAAIALAYAL